MTTITICMGSSCFSRGNSANAEVIQRFIADNALEDRVAVRGCLCEGECKNGPNIRINDRLYTDVSPETLPELLAHEIGAGL